MLFSLWSPLVANVLVWEMKMSWNLSAFAFACLLGRVHAEVTQLALGLSVESFHVVSEPISSQIIPIFIYERRG